jgi:5-(carboxyamino)imidazole ribonucleotide synthase
MMLCEAAPALGLRTIMLAGSADGPAARCADEVVCGAMDDGDALEQLIERCDVVTYEREDLPPRATAALRAAQAQDRVQCFPPLDCIEMLQDKIRQKRWYAEHELATLPFAIVDGSEASLRDAAANLGLPLVQKAPRGGFDGRGVQLLRSADVFVSRAWPGETLVEQYAGEFREIAVLVVRARDGARDHFGPVDMSFEPDYSVLDTVSAPAAISEEVRSHAVDLAYRAIEAMRGVGVFGVEMFLLAGGEVLINEISPRVHNAGHYSLVACASTQFEQHLRAVAGLPLASTEQKAPAAMKNVLCTPPLEAKGVTEQAGHFEQPDGAVLCWYGKSPARAMRKLGHVAATGATPKAALDRCETHWRALQQVSAARGDEQ